MSLKFFKIMLVFSCFLLTDCRENGSVVETQKGDNRIEVTPGRANLVAGGPSVQFSALLINSSGEEVKGVKFVWASDDETIFTVDQNGLAKGIKVGVARVTAKSELISSSALIGVVSANPGASAITLSGKATYEDKPFDENGFTGNIELKPVRKAFIEIVAIDGFNTIASGASNDLGEFNISADNSGQRGGVYLRVVSTSDPADASKLEIRNNPRDQALYSLVSPGIDDSTARSFSAPLNLNAKPGGAGGAFNLFDVFLDASEFLRQAGPCPPPNTSCLLPELTSYWERGSKEGTYFVSPQNEIFVLGGGGNGDADEYDDSVIIHEFGHFVLSQFSKDDSPGGAHALSENDQDIRLSWSEGWANFFSSAVRGTPIYVDTVGSDRLLSFNIEDYTTLPPSTLNASARYTTSEIAVAGVLWDLLDPTDTATDNDPIDLSFAYILQTVMSFPSLSSATMETFWLEFEKNAATAPSVTEIQTIMRGRGIELFADNGPQQALDTGIPQHFTTYRVGTVPDGDIDIIPFTVDQGVRYTVNTLNLTNGADTLLSIKEQTGTLVGQNDNASGLSFSNCSSACPPNGRTNLASSVPFVWNGNDGEQLEAHVAHSPSAPPSAGRFGAYDIQLETLP